MFMMVINHVITVGLIYNRLANRSREENSFNFQYIRYKDCTNVVLSTDPMQDHPIETEYCISDISMITSISIYTEISYKIQSRKMPSTCQ